LSKQDLPQGWQQVQIDDVCFVKGGKRLPNGETYTNEVTEHPYIRVADMELGGINTSNLRYISPEIHSKISRYIITTQDVYISIAGTIGLVGTIPQYLDGANLTENAARLIIKDNSKLDRDFLRLVLQSQIGKEAIENRTRTVGQPKLALERIKSIEFPLPPLAEQKRIAVIIDEQVQEVEVARQAILEELAAAEKLRLAVLDEIFTSKAIISYPRIRIQALSRLVKDGPHITPHYVNKGIPFVTVKNIVNRCLDMSETKFVTEEDHKEFSKQAKAERGDILYTKDGTLGVPCLIETDAEFSYFVSVALIKLRRDIVNPHYVTYALDSSDILRQVETLATGSGLKHMVLGSIKALEIHVPPLEVQNQAVHEIQSKLIIAQNVLAQIHERLEAIEAMPATILHRAFSGGY
jgi:type I restriction enzyme, S subunit